MSVTRLRTDKYSKLWSILHEMNVTDFRRNPVCAIILLGKGRKRRTRLHRLTKTCINEQNNSNVNSGKKSKGIREVKGKRGSLTSNRRSTDKVEKAQVLKICEKTPPKQKKRFPCKICGRDLSTKSNLQRHSLKHSKEENL